MFHSNSLFQRYSTQLPTRSFFAEHGTKGAGKALQVHAEAAIPYVVELDFLAQAALEGRGVAVGGLPQARDARGDAQQLLLLLVGEVLIELVARDGARADHGQVTLEHVEELRHLVDGALTDEPADLGDARVVVDLALDLPLVELLGAQVLVHVVGIGDHAAKLMHANHPASPAHALLRVDRAARRLRANRGTDTGHGNRQHRGASGAECYIERSLAYAVEEGPRRFPRHGLAPRQRKSLGRCL